MDRVLIIGSHIGRHVTEQFIEVINNDIQIVNEKVMHLKIMPIEECLDTITESKTFNKLQNKRDNRFRAKHFRKL